VNFERFELVIVILIIHDDNFSLLPALGFGKRLQVGLARMPGCSQVVTAWPQFCAQRIMATLVSLYSTGLAWQQVAGLCEPL